MLHTIARTLRRYYLGGAFACYLLSFVLAFVMVFALPIGALGMVFLALMALIPVVICWTILCAVEHRLALSKLRRGKCPTCNCNAVTTWEGVAGVTFRCAGCRDCFSESGQDVAVEESAAG
ncbi:MAG: hypothetical protein EXS17_02950 [Phycisphaerales bacterium]|nr:hypothetical protein [Phycisphaerales bacterium]